MEALSISNEIMHSGSPLLALFCLVPLYVAIYRSKSYKEAFLLMLLQTLAVHLISSSWLANFHDYAIFTLGASALGTCVMGGCCGAVMYILPSRANSSKKLEELGGRNLFASPLRMIWFACSFLFWEWIKSTGFLAYPWGTIPVAAYKWKIITQIASLTGVWGITFLFALFASFIGESIFFCLNAFDSPVPKKLLATWRTEGIAVLVLFAITAAYGAVEYYMPRTPSKYMNTVIVQQNADPWDNEANSTAASMALTEEGVSEFRDRGFTPDLVLWGEGILDRAFPDAAKHYYSTHPAEESLSDFIKRMNVPFLMGGRVILNQKRHKYGNAAVLYDRTGNYSGYYCKMHLVPFAERLPYPDNPFVSAFIKAIAGFSYGWTPGNQYILFEIPLMSLRSTDTPLEYRDSPFQMLSLRKNGSADPETVDKFYRGEGTNPETSVRFTAPICFEDSFPDVCRPLYNSGSELFLTITNDTWSETNSAEYQHFIASSYLSIEFRTTLVRCANSGYTVVVDPSGRVIDDLPLFTRDHLCAEVPVYDRVQTLYAKYGDWFAYLCIAFVLLYALSVLWSIWFSDRHFNAEYITITAGRREDDFTIGLDEDDDFDEYAEQADVPVLSEKKAAAPARKAPSPAKKKSVSAKKPAVSVKKAASSAKKTAPSAKKTAPSAKKTAPSVKKTAPSVKKAAASVKKTKPSAKKTAVPAKKSAVSSKKAASPAKKAASPAKKNVPSKKKPASAKKQTKK